MRPGEHRSAKAGVTASHQTGGVDRRAKEDKPDRNRLPPETEASGTTASVSSSAASDVLRSEPDAEDRPADIAYRDEYVASGPRLRSGVQELKPVAAPHDPGGDLDGGLGRDLTPGWRDRTRIADQLVMVDMDIGAEYLLAAQKRPQVLVHSNKCSPHAFD